MRGSNSKKEYNRNLEVSGAQLIELRSRTWNSEVWREEKEKEWRRTHQRGREKEVNVYLFWILFGYDYWPVDWSVKRMMRKKTTTRNGPWRWWESQKKWWPKWPRSQSREAIWEKSSTATHFLEWNNNGTKSVIREEGFMEGESNSRE